MKSGGDFDLTSLEAGFFDDPYPVYRELRNRTGPCRQPDGSVIITRYDDVAAVLGDHERFSSDKRIDFRPKLHDGPLYEHHTTSLVFNDPPLHTRVRRLLTPFFTPRTVRTLEPGLEAMIDALIERTAERETIEFVGDFAVAIPLQLIGDMLGIPQDEREPLRRWATVILGALEPSLSDAERAIGDRAVEDFKTYLRDLIKWKRARLDQADETDILSALLAAEDTDGGLTEIELIHNCIFLLNAGHDTTATLIANGLDLLLRFPDQMARLRAEPALIKGAVEEMLRYESPLQTGNRRARVDMTLHGETVAAGSFIHIGIGAANHDERVFDAPERFDITRHPNRHLAFGNGVHTCAGNSLARMEARLAFTRLLARFPAIERAGPVVRAPRARFRVVTALPVRLAA
jgi:cytochrome P450